MALGGPIHVAHKIIHGPVRRRAGRTGLQASVPRDILPEHVDPSLETWTDHARLVEPLNDRLEYVLELAVPVGRLEQLVDEGPGRIGPAVLRVGDRHKGLVRLVVAKDFVKVVRDQGPLVRLEVLVDVVVAGLVPEAVPGTDQETKRGVDQGVLWAYQFADRVVAAALLRLRVNRAQVPHKANQRHRRIFLAQRLVFALVFEFIEVLAVQRRIVAEIDKVAFLLWRHGVPLVCRSCVHIMREPPNLWGSSLGINYILPVYWYCQLPACKTLSMKWVEASSIKRYKPNGC